jgi:hypothetical protein
MPLHVQGAYLELLEMSKIISLSRLQMFVRLLKNSILNKLINNGYNLFYLSIETTLLYAMSDIFIHD